jgi:hypothetical protein
VEVRINKQVVVSISPSSGYACRYVKCYLENVLFSGFNLFNQEYNSLKMVNFNSHSIYKNAASLSSQVFYVKSMSRRPEIVQFDTA